MNVKKVVKAWNERISKNEELVRVCEQVKEVVGTGIQHRISYFIPGRNER